MKMNRLNDRKSLSKVVIKIRVYPSFSLSHDFRLPLDVLPTKFPPKFLFYGVKENIPSACRHFSVRVFLEGMREKGDKSSIYLRR